MEPIKILVCGNQAAFVKSHLITAGTVGLPVEFTFDEQWEGLSKTAVFKAGNIVRDQININQQTTVPAEVLAKPKRQLEIGVYGINEDGTVVLPTVWVTAGQIVPGADPFRDEGTEPSLPVWEQAQKDTVKCTPQSLTLEKQAQARENIGAAELTEYGLNIYSKHSGAGVCLEAHNEKTDTGYVKSIYLRLLGAFGDEPVRLGGLVPGTNDYDAATVGQVMDAIKANLLIVTLSDNQKVASASSVQIHKHIQNGGVVIFDAGASDVDTSVLFALSFSSPDAAVFTSVGEDNVVEEFIIDPYASIVAKDINFVSRDHFNQSLGDIEAALDSIIAIQESLMGGAAG